MTAPNATDGEFEIINALGLHARAAAQLVKIANRYTIDLHFVNGTPILCSDPTFSENSPEECRALPGSELVSHIEAPMPTSAESGGGAIGAPAEVH